MRLSILVLLAWCGCTIDGQTRVATPHHDPDNMSPAELDHQDPAADTSHNPELSRTESHFYEQDGPLGCFRHVACNAGGGGDGVLVAIAGLLAVRRRRYT